MFHLYMFEHATAWLDDLDQESLGLAALLVGGVLITRGFALAKLLIITTTSLFLGRLAYNKIETTSQLIALICSFGVTVCVLELSHRIYPVLVFIMGSSLGGVAIFTIRESLGLASKPFSLLGFTILSSVFVGLLFKHFRDICWRIFTPFAGSFLVAAAVSYFAAEVSENDPKLSDISVHIAHPENIIYEPSGVIFVVSWGVCAFMGWYFQLAVFFGQDDLFALSDDNLKRMHTLLKRFPQLTDYRISDLGKNHSVSSSDSSEPLISRNGNGNQLMPSVTDYRAEAAVILAVLSVLILNYFLVSQPLMFLGHVMFMSSAFLPFITAGLVSYASPNVILPGMFGPRAGGSLARHFTHGTFNGLAMVCAIFGYVCIYYSHRSTGASQLGLDAGNSWGRTLHVWNGYLVLFCMFIQSGTGVAKLIARTTKRHIIGVHGNLGRWIYILAAANQLSGYFFKGLMPLWGSFLLSLMLVTTVSATLFFLSARSHSKAKHFANQVSPVVHEKPNSYVVPAEYFDPVSRLDSLKVLPHQRLDSLRSLSNLKQNSFGGSDKGKSDSDSNFSSRRSSKNEALLKKWEAVLESMEKADTRAILKACFSDWHREAQSQRILKTETALSGSENLVEFLSAAMVHNYDHGVHGA